MRRLLITSVGSRVGQEIVTGVRAAAAPWYVVGTNSEAFAPGVFDCDSAWLVPPVAKTEEFVARLREIVAAERPQLILPARDDDLPILAGLKDELGEFGAFAVVGIPSAIEICRDKYQTAKFLRAAGLPFAETIAYPEEIAPFLERSSYPYLAKPRRGYASRGVRILFSRQEIDQTLTADGAMVLQEYMIPCSWYKSRDEIARDDVYENGAIIQDDEITLQAFLGRQGDILGLCSMRKNKRIGNRAEMLDEPEIETNGRQIFEHLGSAGLIGPCNLQGIETGQGECRYFEVNARHTGGCGHRQAMGFDLFEAASRHFIDGEAKPDCMTVDTSLAYVSKLQATVFRKDSIAVLRDHGVWRQEDET